MLDALPAGNFTFLDATAAQEVLALIGSDEKDEITLDDPDDGSEIGDDTGDAGQGDDDTGGDTGSGDNTGDGSNDVPGQGTANVTKDTADVVITWAYGTNTTIPDFDTENGIIFVDWIAADALEINETSDGLAFKLPGNAQTLTLTGVALADLSPANFTILDATAEAEILALIVKDDDVHGGGGHVDRGHDDDGHSHTHMHVSINLDTPAQIITGFMPAMGDVIELENDIYAENFAIFEEAGEALGQTVRIDISDGGAIKQIILTGFGLDDLDISNFSIANEGVLNEVSSALGTVIVTPGEDTIASPEYDSDGSNPAESKGTTAQGGTKFKADSNADDIVGFDPAKDALDFGGVSVHGIIVTKSETGEIVIDSP